MPDTIQGEQSRTLKQIQDLIEEYAGYPESWDSLKFAEGIRKLARLELLKELKPKLNKIIGGK